MKYGRRREFVDAEIEARMGIDNMSSIEESAKADPTVNDNLLGDTPIPVKDEEAVHANSGPLAAHVEAPGKETVFDPTAIPAAAKKAAPPHAITAEFRENITGTVVPQPIVPPKPQS